MTRAALQFMRGLREYMQFDLSEWAMLREVRDRIDDFLTHHDHTEWFLEGADIVARSALTDGIVMSRDDQWWFLDSTGTLRGPYLTHALADDGLLAYMAAFDGA